VSTAPVRFDSGPIFVVAFCFAMGFVGRGMLETFAVFLLPLSASFGWERTEVVSIYAIAALMSGFTGPLAGWMFERFGPRFVYVAGVLLLATGALAMSIARELWQFMIFGGLVFGVGAALTGNVPSAAMLSRRFGERMALPAGIVFSGFGIGVLVLVPLAQVMIDRWGWRETYLVFGVALVLVLLATALLPWRRLVAITASSRTAPPPTTNGDGEVWTLSRALASRAFWAMFFVYFMTSIAMYAVSPQVVAYLVEIGFSPIQAASAWGVAGFLQPLGMIAIGSLDSWIGRQRAALLSYTISLIGLGAFWLLGFTLSPLLLAVAILCFGSMLGSRGPLISTIAMLVFRGPHAATIFGAIMIGAGGGGALGAVAGGFLHDITDGYGAVLTWSAASVVLAMLPFIFVKELKR
jgi:MFS family permease